MKSPRQVRSDIRTLAHHIDQVREALLRRADVEIAQGVKIKVVKSTISDVLQPGAKPAND